jgi:acyl-CoA synthetase (NDP forming)/RimJ/RimL family protein N-acetyltransferase
VVSDLASTLASAPRRLVRDVLLRDGSTLRLQGSVPADFEDIRSFYESLSPESRYFRFHGYGRTDQAARYEAEASGVDRLALIGRHDGQIVAVASYEGLREPGAAEVSFAVADRFQRRGIGTRMLEQLAAIAADRAIHRFDAEVMAGNRPMLGVFEHAGFAVRREGSFGEIIVSLDITPCEAVTERIDERDHFAAIASLRAVLAPSTVAVAGARATPGNVGQRVLANIIAGGFQGVVGAVNRDGSVVCSMQAARSVAELGFVPELVVIAATGDELLEFASQAAAGESRALLVVPAGTQEDRAAALEVEAQLLDIVRGSGLRLMGPNSFGVINTAPEVRLNAAVGGAVVRPGRLAICSQSGGPGIGLLGHAAARQLGVATHVSTGNRADVSTNDLLECFEEDERAAAVMLYVETFGNPQHFTRIAHRVSRKKPLLALKGRHNRLVPPPGGARSHTAAALRGEAVIDALLHQAGVLRFRTVEELFDSAAFLEGQPLPSGRRIAIVTNSGGVATLAADACATHGLELVSTAGGFENPLMLGINAGAEEYGATIPDRLRDPGIDAVMVLYVDLFGDPEAVLAAVSAASADQPKPVVASIVGADGRLPRSNGRTVPNFLFPESCAAVLTRAAERREWLSRPLGERPQYPDLDVPGARAAISSFLEREPGGGWLARDEAERLLATHGISVAASYRCDRLEEAVAAAATIGGPVALKADFADPAQADGIGAVLVGIDGRSAIRAGWRELEQRVRAADRPWGGATVESLAPGGADMLVGTIVDADLGTVLAVGLGGRQAGLDRTTAFRLPPRTDAEADELIDSSEAVVAELDGFAGRPVLDRAALRELILRFALLLQSVPEVVEADLNPVRCTTGGCVVLDVRIRVEHRRPSERVKTW